MLNFLLFSSHKGLTVDQTSGTEARIKTHKSLIFNDDMAEGCWVVGVRAYNGGGDALKHSDLVVSV